MATSLTSSSRRALGSAADGVAGAHVRSAVLRKGPFGAGWPPVWLCLSGACQGRCSRPLLHARMHARSLRLCRAACHRVEHILGALQRPCGELGADTAHVWLASCLEGMLGMAGSMVSPQGPQPHTVRQTRKGLHGLQAGAHNTGSQVCARRACMTWQTLCPGTQSPTPSAPAGWSSSARTCRLRSCAAASWPAWWQPRLPTGLGRCVIWCCACQHCASRPQRTRTHVVQCGCGLRVDKQFWCAQPPSRLDLCRAVNRSGHVCVCVCAQPATRKAPAEK